MTIIGKSNIAIFVNHYVLNHAHYNLVFSTIQTLIKHLIQKKHNFFVASYFHYNG
jgi:hypothetical protein